MENVARWYGVSSGVGDSGVSRIFADYYVKTADPWRLAELAALTSFAPEYVDRARDEAQVDGDAEGSIYVTFLESPETQAARAEAALAAAQEAMDAFDPDEGGGDEAALAAFEDTGPAWLCFEVFRCEPDEQREGRPTYESLEDCFGEACKLVAPSEETTAKLVAALRAALGVPG